MLPTLNFSTPRNEVNFDEEVKEEVDEKEVWIPEFTILGENEYKWIDDIKDLFTCVVCKNVVISSTLCGRCLGALCISCENEMVNVAMSNDALFQNNNINCPKCRFLFYDRYFGRHVCELQKRLVNLVQCQCNHCSLIFSVGDMLEIHKDNCCGKPIRCPFTNCTETIVPLNTQYQTFLQHVEAAHQLCTIIPSVNYNEKLSFTLDFAEFISITNNTLTDVFTVVQMVNGSIVLFIYRYMENVSTHVITCRTLSQNDNIRLYCILKWEPFQYLCNRLMIKHTETTLAMSNHPNLGNNITIEVQIAKINI